MGFLFRLLAPKPLKKVRRAMHPVSLLTPRPVRNVKRTAAKVVNPVGAIGDAFENEALRLARGKKRPRGGRGADRRSSGGAIHESDYEIVVEPYVAPAPTVRTAAQGGRLELRC